MMSGVPVHLSGCLAYSLLSVTMISSHIYLLIYTVLILPPSVLLPQSNVTLRNAECRAVCTKTMNRVAIGLVCFSCFKECPRRLDLVSS